MSEDIPKRLAHSPSCFSEDQRLDTIAFNPFFFVHVPKTGGSSVLAALKSSVGKSNIKGVAGHHPGPSAVFRWGIEWWESMYTFGFVRNPWDRFYSLYNWQFQIQPDVKTPIEDWPFERYTKAVLVDKLQELMRIYRNIRPMKEWLFSGDVQIVDYVGRYEEIEKSWKTICEEIEIKHQPLPHKNRTEHPEYLQVYRKHPELVDIVADFYRHDIETFGYDLGC